jgi:hypothetical protein
MIALHHTDSVWRPVIDRLSSDISSHMSLADLSTLLSVDRNEKAVDLFDESYRLHAAQTSV